MTSPDPLSGASLHYRALESLYGSAPVNALFESSLEVVGEGRSRIEFTVTEAAYHAAGAAHGTIYFKMLDDAAFYAANALVSDRFLLTTAFNLHFTKPMKEGPARAEGRWISGLLGYPYEEDVRAFMFTERQPYKPGETVPV